MWCFQTIASFKSLDQPLKVKISEVGGSELTPPVLKPFTGLYRALNSPRPLFNSICSPDEPLFPDGSLQHEWLRAFQCTA